MKLKGVFIVVLTAQYSAFCGFFYVITLTFQGFDGYIPDSDTR